jgi:DNA polymerase-3 subunit delta
VTFTPEKILSDTSLFYDETNAQSLMGGNRLIIIKDGSDSLSPIMKDYLDNPSDQTLVIIESDNLGPRSSLRKLCEGAKNAAAVPCYVDDERSLSQIIRDMCAHAGYGIDQDALMAFSSALVGDRTIARNEIEKLILYKGWPQGYEGPQGEPIRQKSGQITFGDVQACIGDVRDWSMDTLVYAIGDGDMNTVRTILQSLFNEQTPVIILLRATQNHFWRLLQVQTKIKDGLSHGEALKTLNPPLFFKVEDSFKRQLNRWTAPALEAALDSLNKTEAMAKKTGYSDQGLVENAFAQLCRYNPNNRKAA